MVSLVKVREAAFRIGLSASVVIPVLVVLWACQPDVENRTSSTGGGEQRPPLIRTALIQPSPIVLDSPASVYVEVGNSDQDAMTIRYRWIVNGQLVAEKTDDPSAPALMKKGDRVTVEVIPSHGALEGMPFKTEPTVVANTPPAIRDITLLQDEETQGRKLLVKAEIDDPDHDDVSAVYRWYKNDNVIQEGPESKLDIAEISTKDVIEVDVIPSDGQDAGKVQRSLPWSLSNTAPRITSTPTAPMSHERYRYLVQARDDDGDALSYSLEVAPPDMTIDMKTGQIEWNIKPGVLGNHRVRVVAQDSRGGFASQEFEINLSLPSASSAS